MKTIKIDSNFKMSREEFLDVLNSIPKDSFEICFKYKSDFWNTKIIRDFVEFIFDFFNFPDIWKTRFILIVDELNNNAIEYWTRSWQFNELRIFIKETWIKNYKVKIEVEDTWEWVANKTASEMCKLAEKKKKRWFDNYHSIRWRGLFLIIDRMVDKLYFKDSKKWWLIVWLKKEISLDKETNYYEYPLKNTWIEKLEENFEDILEKLDNEEIKLEDIWIFDFKNKKQLKVV